MEKSWNDRNDRQDDKMERNKCRDLKPSSIYCLLVFHKSREKTLSDYLPG